MRIAANRNISQLPKTCKSLFSGHIARLLCFLIIVLCFLSCDRKKEDIPAAPPVTSPLSRVYIGYGVITASFTHITADPEDDSPSIGYLRRGSLVRIVKRQTIKTQNKFVTWVLTDGSAENTDTDGLSNDVFRGLSNDVSSGWLKEEVMDIYDNESQARTASESLFK